MQLFGPCRFSDPVVSPLDRVRPEADGTVIVTFVDHLHRRELRHTHSCEQRREFAPDGAIRMITHLELPGERAALDAFLAKVGVRR